MSQEIIQSDQGNNMIITDKDVSDKLYNLIKAT